MKNIFRNMLDRVKPVFEKGGRLEKLYPAYDAFETFLFVPNHVTKSGVHIRDGMDLKRTMVVVILAMMPVLLFGMYNIGFQHYAQLNIEPGFFEIFLFGFKKVIPLEMFTSNDQKFYFHTYVIAIDNEFIPVLNEEHSGYCWTAFECWPKNLHTGLRNTLNNKSIKGKLQTILDLIT